MDHNVLTGGSVGHIARSRTFDPSANVTLQAATDRWFHYDQVGSVMMETNRSGGVASVRHKDAWGNSLSDWQSGAWASVAGDEWGHNTKERSGIHGMTYMYQRWYSAETGTFLSKAPYQPDIEHEYGFALNNPLSSIDPDGRKVRSWPGNGRICNNSSYPLPIWNDIKGWQMLPSGECTSNDEDWDFICFNNGDRVKVGANRLTYYGNTYGVIGIDPIGGGNINPPGGPGLPPGFTPPVIPTPPPRPDITILPSFPGDPVIRIPGDPGGGITTFSI